MCEITERVRLLVIIFYLFVKTTTTRSDGEAIVGKFRWTLCVRYVERK